ncbi:complement C4-B [Aplochiton taeniatus]
MPPESSQGLTADNLKLIGKNMTWNEAVSYCREHHIDLVSVTTATIQDWVAKLTANASTSHIWLGLRYTCTFNFWFWIRSDTGCYQNWAPGHGSPFQHDCGAAGAIEATGEQQFFISAPNVFHVGVTEKVFVQLGKSLVNVPVTIYLEDELTGRLMSEKRTTSYTKEGDVQTVELKINREEMVRLPPFKFTDPYLLLVAESSSFSRRLSRVLVSQRRGYIFIQTDQPIYNPTQPVKYRIFTLDHSMRPKSEVIQLSIFNAAGNRIMKNLKAPLGGILSGSFAIPDVSEMGVWKIVAHYQGDEKNAATRDFQVKKFVLPSFEVVIQTEKSYILPNTDELHLKISALYSYGERIKGAYHCRFGVKQIIPDGNKENIVPIRGLELTGSINDEEALAVLQIANLSARLKAQMNLTLSDLEESGAELYLAVSVTDILSGELQEEELSFPIISQLYVVDLSRIRSHYIPGAPLNVMVNVDGQSLTKKIKRATSPSNSYLYLSISNTIQTVDDSFSVNYLTINGQPEDGFIYYMVLSRGTMLKQGSIRAGNATRDHLVITHNMIPSFRLIGYYYNQNGDIIADSVWVDVKDECEKKVKVSSRHQQYHPGKIAKLDLNLHGQRAKVALLAVDKAIYALNAGNKLTLKQVFSAMKSYDLGCSYAGGADPSSTLNEAGISFLSQSDMKSVMRKGFSCEAGFRRHRRSLDLQQAMMTIKSNYTVELQRCCAQGFSLIPMRRTCEQRQLRVFVAGEGAACAQAFLECCLQGERLRQKKIQEDGQKGYGRTASASDIEEFFLDNNMPAIRHFFPQSFDFKVIDINNEGRYDLILPDSITTWELQAVTISAEHGFCVAEPFELTVFKTLFVNLKLPYSVKKYEQLAIVAIIYNYGEETKQLAVSMDQSVGLCSPGSTLAVTYVNVTVNGQSSQTVTFSAVPMVNGNIPIKIRLYDRETQQGSDAIQKVLNVRTEGLEKREEETHVVDLEARRGTVKSFNFKGDLPDSVVPGTSTNIFVSIEGEVFGKTTAQRLLSPEGVASLLRLPYGCGEQTMKCLAPTALALRYIDLSKRWFELPPGTRDLALRGIEEGYIKILTFKKDDGSYGAWIDYPSSYWLTGLVVKVFSLVAHHQKENNLVQGSPEWEEEINQSVRFLITKQNDDGSFVDPNPVIEREMQGGVGGLETKASMTAFIAIALNRSLIFLNNDTSETKLSISNATTYLSSHLEELERPYAVAIAAYCLSVCQSDKEPALRAWIKLQKLATKGEDGCRHWKANAELVNQEKPSYYGPPPVEAITVETTAYALLTAVQHGDTEWADAAACWLTSQENYGGGFKSTQDTIVALEALSEYALKRPPPAVTQMEATFTSPGKTALHTMSLENKGPKVEIELPKLGNDINVQVSGQGKAKMKVIETYDYYSEDYAATEAREEENVPQSAIEWFDARTRRRRDTDQSLSSQNQVNYEVCISHNLSRNLTGMSIADITLLSGFEAQTVDLDKLKELPEQYISHYEVSHGRVLLYFNEIMNQELCIEFGAIQTIRIGLLQPAPASYYDYYEPDRKCTIFYGAPQRSTMVSKLCAGDVCQCAERYIIEVLSVTQKSNFELYNANVTEVLRKTGDESVVDNPVRVFAKRLQCKGQLEKTKSYLVMGKDGSTTDSNGQMQYLLESNTWVEQKPNQKMCKPSSRRNACKKFNDFVSEYKTNGCTI